MRKAVVTVAALLPAAALFTAQLPPDVQVDRLWLRAERQIDNEEYWSALASLEEILDLQAEHGIAVPDSFWFSHALASHRAGLHTQAAASATRYVEATGRNGEHYLAALELLDAAEAAAEREAAELRRLAAQRERQEREAETQRAARQATIDAQAEATAEREEEMAQVAAELARLAPGMEMVVIPAGTFEMGCASGVGCRDGVLPVHQVTILRPFAAAKHEVTYAQWNACVAGGGCLDAAAASRRERRRGYRPDDEGWGRGNRPVVNVSWEDARAYVRWLSSQTGASYRLLSEAEWEYSARAGTSSAYSWGDEIGSGRASCSECGTRWDDHQTAPVGSFSPNAWGLYDMHGNAFEWVQDCWNESYTGAPGDGSAWQEGDCSERVLRGGSVFFHPSSLRSRSRVAFSSGFRDRDHGFRVARTLAP